MESLPSRQRLLSLTLALGNYLNGTSRQGGAYGFKLSALAELQSCKSQDGQMTLLHYIAKTTAAVGPDGGPLVAQLKRELSCFDDPVRFEWQRCSGRGHTRDGKGWRAAHRVHQLTRMEAPRVPPLATRS